MTDTQTPTPEVVAKGAAAFDKLYELTGRWDYDQFNVSPHLVDIRAALTGEALATFEDFYDRSGYWTVDHSNQARLADEIRAALTAA
jgi:hypothetical protein